MADGPFLFIVALTGCATALAAFATYSWALQMEEAVVARTYAFAAIVFTQLFCAFGFLSETEPVWRAKTLANLRLAATITGTMFLQIAFFRNAAAAHFFKTSIVSWPACFGLAFVSLTPLAILEMAKAWRRHREKIRAAESDLFSRTPASLD